MKKDANTRAAVPDDGADRARRLKSATDRLRTALPKRDLDGAAAALGELLRMEPIRWSRIIALTRVLPPLGATDADTVAATLVGAAAKAAAERLESGGADGIYQACVNLLRWSTSQALVFSDFSRRVAKIRTRLESLSFLDESPATQFYILGLLVEHQAQMAGRAFSDESRQKLYIDPYSIAAGILESPFMGPRVSVPAAYESVTEAAELVIRFAQHQNRATEDDTPDFDKSPFSVPELPLLLLLADMWAALREDWERIHQQNWHVEDEDDVSFCSPVAPTDVIRGRVGQVREQVLRIEHAYSVKQLGRQRHTDTPENLDLLARSMSVATSTPWDCEFDTAVLRIAAMNTEWAANARSWIAIRHFDSLITNPKLDWAAWFRVRELLVLISRAYRRAVTLAGGDVDSESALPRTTPVISRSVLAARLSEVDGAPSGVVERALDASIFNRNRRSLELWDQPLIPVSSGRVLLIPGLIIPGDPARALENMATEWAPELFSARGPSYERVLASLSAKRVPGKTVRDIKFEAYDGRSVEFDLIIHWDGWLLLIEAKCVKSVHTPYEEALAADVVDEAVEQLRRRLLVVANDWPSLREHAKAAALPEAPPPRERIIPIVLLNILTFTGMETADGIMVTDDFCFYRYFEGAIEKFLLWRDGSLGRIGTIPGIPEVPGTPDQFLAYLRDPPQVRGIASRLSVAYREVVRVDDKDPKVAYFDLESAGPPRVEGPDGV